jgi:hypothetical protein
VRVVAIAALGAVLQTIEKLTYGWQVLTAVSSGHIEKLGELKAAHEAESAAIDANIKGMLDYEKSQGNVNTSTEELKELMIAVRSPQETFIANIARSTELYNAGKINLDLYTKSLAQYHDELKRGADQAATPFDKEMAKLQDKKDKISLSPRDYQKKQLAAEITDSDQVEQLMKMWDDVAAAEKRLEASKDQAKELASAAKQHATAEKSRRNAVIETIASLQSELEINRLGAKDAALQTSLRQHLAKAVGAERVQITDLINQIHAENEAREKQKASGEKAKSEMDALIDKYNQLTLSARDYYAAKLQADGLSPEQSKPLLAQFDKNAAFEQTKKQTDDARAAVDDYAKSLEQAAGKMSDMGFVSASVFDGALGGVNAISGAFSNMVKSIQENTDALDALNKNKALNELDKENKNYQKNVVTFAKEEAKLKQANLDASIDGIMQIAGATSQMFEQNSEEAKAMNLVVLGGLAAKAAAAILTQGTGDPYTAFARIAAMGALVAGIMSAAGAGGFDFSGGGASAPPPTSSDIGTVLGDSKSKSNSVGNTYELLQDIHAREYATLRSIDRGISNLKTGINDVITRVFQAGGIAAPTIDTTAKLSGLGNIAQMGASIGSFGLAKMDPISNFILGGLFGKTTRSVIGSGIGTNAANLSDIMSGSALSGYQYATIETKKKSWFSSKTSYSEQRQALDDATGEALTDVFRSMGETMIGLAVALGHDTKSKVEGYVIPAMKIDLHGLSGKDASEKLTGVVSAALDTMSDTVFGEILGQYQQLGEGMLETTTRIVSEIAIVQDALHQSGVSLAGDVIAVSDAIAQASGGLKEFQSAFEQAFDKFASDDAKQKRLAASLQAQLVELFPQSTINTLAKSRDEYAKLVASLDQANPRYAEQYALLIKLAEGADQYYASIEETRQALSDLTQTFLSFSKNLQSVRGSIGSNIISLGGSSSSSGPAWQQSIIDNLYKQLELTTSNADKISIIGDINTAVMNRYNAELEMLGKVDDAVKRIRDYLNSLKLGDKSPLTNSQKLAESQSQFSTQLAMAKAGDKDALAGITGIADAYLQQARAYYASSDTYTGIFSRVTSTLEQLAIPKGMDEATYKVESIKLQDKALSELKALDNTLLDIYAKEQTATAVRHMELLSALGGANDMDVKSALADAAMALGRQLTAFEAQWIKDQFALGRDKAAIYAEAGQYIKLHGSHADGLDYVPFDGYRAELHKGERVLTAAQARRQDGENDPALIAELRALRAEVAQLRAEQRDQTGALIQSHYDANDRASDKIVKGSKEAAKDSAWANRSKAVIA